MNSWALARTREAVESLHGARLDPDLLRQEVARTLRPAVPFEGWCITTVDPDTLLVSSVVADNPGMGDELRVELAVDGRCWGTIEVVRERRGRCFSDEEADFALRLAPRVARLLREAQARTWSAAGVGDSGPDPQPGVLVVDGSLAVAAITSDAEPWLTELTDAAASAGSILPAPILAAAACVHPSGSGTAGTATSSRVRVLTRAGRWVTISAGRLTGPNLVGHTAVTLQRSGLEVTDLVLEAHGLTPRERQLAGLVLDGLSNDQIARRLFLSRYTVGDHVKAILGKVGARSKQEFIASTLGGADRAHER